MRVFIPMAHEHISGSMYEVSQSDNCLLRRKLLWVDTTRCWGKDYLYLLFDML